MPDNDLVQKISDMLMAVLVKQFGDQDLFDTVSPILPVLVRLGVEQGVEQAEATLKGLAGDDPYIEWRRLIESATPDERVVIMEQTRQAAIRDRIREMERRADLYAAFKTGISILIGMIGLLI